MSLYITYATIDPELIRRQFVPRLLGRDVGRTPFDADADAEALWDQARTALSELPIEAPRRRLLRRLVGADGPSDAIGETTQLIMRLAILWSTAQLPYLGIEFRHAGAVVGPPPISEDPQPLFAHLVSAFPALDGAFGATRPIYPRAGSYAPPGLMPDLLAWLTRQSEDLPASDRRRLRPVAELYSQAVQQELGIWESHEVTADEDLEQDPWVDDGLTWGD